MGRLESLEALAKLFNNFWFYRIRQDIKDDKVQAYLTVFDDAFPHINHVIEFVRRSAGLLSEGEASQDEWQRLQSEFDYLHRLLKAEGDDLGGTASIAASVLAPAAAVVAVDSIATEANSADANPGADVTYEEQEALESVEQSDIDSLLDEDNGDDEIDDIDALFEEEEEEEETVSSDEAPSISGEMIDEDEELDESEVLEAAALLETGNSSTDHTDVDTDEDRSADSEEPATATAVEQELDGLLEGPDEDDMAEEDVDLEDLLGDERDSPAGGPDASPEDSGSKSDSDDAAELLSEEEGDDVDLEDLLGDEDDEDDASAEAEPELEDALFEDEEDG